MRMSNSLDRTARTNNKTLHWILFGVLISPLLFYWVYSIWLNPSKNYYTNDAEFPHFMNSLAVFKGGRYGYIDHPGTPVQILGTVILGIMYPFTKDAPGGFVTYYLQEPGRFLDVAHALLIFLYLLTTCFFFWTVRSRNTWKDVLYAAGLAVLYYAIHPDALSASTVWNHNSFNFPFGATLLLCLYGVLIKDGTHKEIPIGALIGLGIGAGIMTATTIYMAGWVIAVGVAVFLYHLLQRAPWQRTLFATGLAGFSAIGGFFLSVLPIFDKLSHFRNWIASLLTHESNFLDVPENQPRLERLASNFIEFYRILPVLFIFLVLLVIFSVILFFLFRRKLTENPGLWAIIIAVGAQSTAIVLMFLDRPLNEMYFQSIATILPVWTMALLEVVKPYIKNIDLLRGGVTVFALVGMTVTSINSVYRKGDEVLMLRNSQDMISSTIQSIAQQTGRSPDDVISLWMHGTSSQCWGIRLGDSKAYNIFTKEIESICPGQYLLSTGLRVGKFGNNYPIENESWDVIFACEKDLKRLERIQVPIHVQSFPQLKWICGTPVTVTHD